MKIIHINYYYEKKKCEWKFNFASKKNSTSLNLQVVKKVNINPCVSQ